MSKLLRRTRFGNPILRKRAKPLTASEINSAETQQLIADMFYTLEKKRYGVGLAAPQVGKSLALCIVGIKPTPTRPHNKRLQLVLINPVIVKTYGPTTPLWEGCISFGDPYAQALRYKKIRARYLDEQGNEHEEDFEGTMAHVLQHEIDHLNGVLFVDHVTDPKTYITIQEFRRYYLKATKSLAPPSSKKPLLEPPS